MGQECRGGGGWGGAGRPGASQRLYRQSHLKSSDGSNWFDSLLGLSMWNSPRFCRLPHSHPGLRLFDWVELSMEICPAENLFLFQRRKSKKKMRTQWSIVGPCSTSCARWGSCKEERWFQKFQGWRTWLWASALKTWLDHGMIMSRPPVAYLPPEQLQKRASVPSLSTERPST